MTSKNLILILFCVFGLTAFGQKHRIDLRTVQLHSADSFTNTILDTISVDCIKLRGNPQTIAELRPSEIKKLKKIAQKWGSTNVCINLKSKTCNNNEHFIVLLAKTYNKK